MGEAGGQLQLEELEWDDAGVVRVKDVEAVKVEEEKPAQYVPMDIKMEDEKEASAQEEAAEEQEAKRQKDAKEQKKIGAEDGLAAKGNDSAAEQEAPMQED